MSTECKHKVRTQQDMHASTRMVCCRRVLLLFQALQYLLFYWKDWLTNFSSSVATLPPLLNFVVHVTGKKASSQNG
eukprot:1077820-Pelagomonas_calceolata.AAC.2